MFAVSEWRGHSKAGSTKYTLLNMLEIRMAGYWPRSFFASLWTETKSDLVNKRFIIPYSQKTSLYYESRTNYLFRESGKKVNFICSKINPRESYTFSFDCISNCLSDSIAAMVQNLRTL